MYAKLTWKGSGTTISNICKDICNAIAGQIWISGSNFNATTHAPEGSHGFSADLTLATSEIWCTNDSLGQSAYDVTTNPEGWQIYDAEGSTGTAGLAILSAANGSAYGGQGSVYCGILAAATTITARCYEAWNTSTNTATNPATDNAFGASTNLTTTVGSLYIYANKNIVIISCGAMGNNANPHVIFGKHTRQAVWDVNANTWPNIFSAHTNGTGYKPKSLKTTGVAAVTTEATLSLISILGVVASNTIFSAKTVNDGTNNYYQFFPLTVNSNLSAASVLSPLTGNVTLSNDGSTVLAPVYAMHAQLHAVVGFGDEITYSGETYFLMAYYAASVYLVIAFRKG